MSQENPTRQRHDYTTEPLQEKKHPLQSSANITQPVPYGRIRRQIHAFSIERVKGERSEHAFWFSWHSCYCMQFSLCASWLQWECTHASQLPITAFLLLCCKLNKTIVSVFLHKLSNPSSTKEWDDSAGVPEKCSQAKCRTCNECSSSLSLARKSKAMTEMNFILV